MGNQYDYYSDWSQYACSEEKSRFLTDEELLASCCDCLDLNASSQSKTSGGIPVLYRDGKLYVLKEGHTKTEAESGNMKSRTVARGSVISSAGNGDSCIITDPKGEICSDPKIIGFLKDRGVKVHVLDFRNFDKDGFNVLAYPMELMKAGDINGAANHVSNFAATLLNKKKTNDDFWNDSAKMLIEGLANSILTELSKRKNGSASAHLATLMKFICKPQGQLKEIMERLSEKMLKENLYNPVDQVLNILANPEKTYACIMTSTMALLKDFQSSPALTKMLSVSTFDIRDFYERPSALFIVVPDETTAYNSIAGYLMDTMYQLLISAYTERYQNRRKPFCRIHFICDEFANIKINDMGAKISASRSREIEWTLIYQSEKQMKVSYENDYDTIRGNCRNTLFLGSSDYGLLESISEQCGYTNMTPDGRREPLVRVEDLRKMKKTMEYKDALLIRGNDLYTAKLPDYEQYPFLDQYKNKKIQFDTNILEKEVTVFTPERLRSELIRRSSMYDF